MVSSAPVHTPNMAERLHWATFVCLAASPIDVLKYRGRGSCDSFLDMARNCMLLHNRACEPTKRGSTLLKPDREWSPNNGYTPSTSIGSSGPTRTCLSSYCCNALVTTIQASYNAQLTSTIDGCNLSSFTRPEANALAADFRTNQWVL
jgi:hypothetical protein